MPIDLNGNILSSTSITGSTFSNTVVTDGLVLHLDPVNKNSYDGSSTSIYDISGNNYTGTLINGVTYNTNALVLNGSSQYINMNTSALVPAGASSYSVSVWVYRNRNNGGAEEVLSQWTTANSGNSFFFGFNNSNVRFSDTWSNVTVSGAGTINTWMNIVGVNFGGSNAHIFINGNLMAVRGSALTYTGTGNMIIGRQGEYSGGEYFSGRIGQTLIYNKALNKGEILNNYYSTKAKYGL
jgi:hypothetical protein